MTPTNLETARQIIASILAAGCWVGLRDYDIDGDEQELVSPGRDNARQIDAWLDEARQIVAWCPKTLVPIGEIHLGSDGAITTYTDNLQFAIQSITKECRE